MKRIFFLCAMLYSVSLLAQDSIKTSRTRHEVGLNATLLFKQILSFGTNNLTLSPYNVTYKFICGNWAPRAGLGVQLVSTEADVKGASEPRETKSSYVAYRVGMERQFRLSERFTSYVGLDVVSERFNSRTVQVSVTDNLPNNYSYSRTTTLSKEQNVGGGPVAGIQFWINKRLSLFAEATLYYTKGKNTDNMDSYQKNLPFSGAEYIVTTRKEEFKSKYARLVFTSPVTIYISFKL